MNFRIALCLALLAAAALWSCGPKDKTTEAGDLDTSLYSKYIQKGPDTNLYPLHQSASSQHFPLEKFGFSQLFDGNEKTAWKSQGGTNCGEYIDFRFDDLPASRLKIRIANDLTVAKVTQVQIVANDSVLGTFFSGSVVNLPSPLQRLKITALDAEGLNEVKLPVVNDTTSRQKTTGQVIKTRYNSKSFGISELEFFDASGKKLPVQAIPYRRANVSSATMNGGGADRFSLFDGNPETGASWSQAGGSDKLFISFKDFTPILKLRIISGVEGIENVAPVKEMQVSANSKKSYPVTLVRGENTVALPEPMVSKSYTFSIGAFAPGNASGGIAELYGYDGARWYAILPDSADERTLVLADSLRKTGMRHLVNSRVYYSEKNAELNSDTLNIRNIEAIDIVNLSSSRETDSEIIFRTNGSFEFLQKTSKVTYGKTPVNSLRTVRIQGRWHLLQAGTDHAELRISGWLEETVIVNGKPAPTTRRPLQETATVQGNALSMGAGTERMLVSY